jgi:hypothetical protein
MKLPLMSMFQWLTTTVVNYTTKLGCTSLWGKETRKHSNIVVSSECCSRVDTEHAKSD